MLLKILRDCWKRMWWNSLWSTEIACVCFRCFCFSKRSKDKKQILFWLQLSFWSCRKTAREYETITLFWIYILHVGADEAKKNLFWWAYLYRVLMKCTDSCFPWSLLLTCFPKTDFISMSHVNVSFMWQRFDTNAAKVRAQQINQNITRISVKIEKRKGLFLWIPSLPWLLSTQSIHNIQKTYFSTSQYHFYYQKGSLKSQRWNWTEDAEHQVHRPREVPMCYFDDRRWSKDSYSMKDIYNLSYNRFLEAHYQSLEPKK